MYECSLGFYSQEVPLSGKWKNYPQERKREREREIEGAATKNTFALLYIPVLLVFCSISASIVLLLTMNYDIYIIITMIL